MAARFPFYIVMYMLYIIGYTCQCVVTKSAQSCLTNDPEQRPYFTIFDSAYNTVIFAVLPVYVTGTLMPKYGGAAAFTTAAFFQELWLFFWAGAVHTAFWSTAGNWASSTCLSAGPVSALHLLWLTS